MKFKKTILAIFIIQFITGVLCSSVFAVYPGTFYFNNETAYIIERSKQEKKFLLYIDFKNKIKKTIKIDLMIEPPSINRRRKLLAFINMTSIVFYDIEKEKEIFIVSIKSGEKITWDDSGEKISYYDALKKVIMEVDVNNREIIKIPFSGIMFQTKWDEKMNSFLYQLMDKYPNDDMSNLDAKIMRSVDGKLEEYKGVKTLTMSPDGKYYFEGKEYLEMGNVVYFYKTDGNKLIAEFESSTSLDNVNEMWGVDTVRFLSQGGVFDFKSGKFISNTDFFWRSNDFIPLQGDELINTNPRRDVAADWNNYVLMWNKDTKIFEVEDINTGKIIKIYKKFW
ncbi:MAG TPA: hypothetical protein ENJ60_09420 [Aeromonadales bacterium]|nr:hypothetical protein [Aeromonadales bacterium]